MDIVCDKNTCTGCMACVNACPKSAITIVDSIEAFNAVIDHDKCVNCNLCQKVCPNVNPRQLQSPIYWKQGWAEDEIRKNSSSGGYATAIIKNFIITGGYVASCLFNEGEFTFKVTNDLEIAKKFSGSKYVKSNPGNVYIEIKKLLKQGEKVLFIGLPCQCAAVQNVCGEHDKLYTADLICHGTPSPKILKSYIKEVGVDWESINDIKFRENSYFGLAPNGNRITPKRVQDSYMRLFLNSVDYTENCYSCRYATSERVSDITLGDAWGQLSEEIPGGVSIALCQTQKGIELIQVEGLHLEDADLEKAIKANHQLEHPSRKHPGRTRFFNKLNAGRSIRFATFEIMPKESIKHITKNVMIKMHILKDFS